MFQPLDAKLYFTKNDPKDPRLGDLVIKTASKKDDIEFILAGYPDDEGIKLNGGRLGAAEGPNKIREFFYKMTPSLFESTTPKFMDIGNLNLKENLEQRHEFVRASVKSALEKENRWIGLGGGHDYGYSDGAGFLDWCQTQKTTKPMIINFDAHLDVRPKDKGPSSGTPFRRLLELGYDFDFFEIGIQNQCNSQEHLKWCQAQGTKILFWDEIMMSQNSQSLSVLRFLEENLISPRPCFLSIDIDGFASSYAPGCSQSFATGFEPNEFFKVLEVLRKRLNIKVLGIYEVSPPLDTDNRTSKLAAQILHRFMF